MNRYASFWVLNVFPRNKTRRLSLKWNKGVKCLSIDWKASIPDVNLCCFCSTEVDKPCAFWVRRLDTTKSRIFFRDFEMTWTLPEQLQVQNDKIRAPTFGLDDTRFCRIENILRFVRMSSKTCVLETFQGRFEFWITWSRSDLFLRSRCRVLEPMCSALRQLIVLVEDILKRNCAFLFIDRLWCRSD